MTSHVRSRLNQSLQLTLDPAANSAVAESASASSAAEHRRYAAQDTSPLAGATGDVRLSKDIARSVRY